MFLLWAGGAAVDVRDPGVCDRVRRGEVGGQLVDCDGSAPGIPSHPAGRPLPLYIPNPMDIYTKPCIYIHTAPRVPRRPAGPSPPLIGHQNPVRISVGMSLRPYGLPIVAVSTCR